MYKLGELMSTNLQVMKHTSTVYCPVLNFCEIERIIGANIANLCFYLCLYLCRIIVYLL